MRRFFAGASELGAHPGLTAMTMAAAGLGITPVPRSFKVAHPGLTFIDYDEPAFFMDMVLAYDGRSHRPQLHAFVELCRTWHWAGGVPPDIPA